MTITTVAQRHSSDDAFSTHACVLGLLAEATALPPRQGLSDVLQLVTAAVRDDALTPATAFDLGQQLRLVIGDAPADDDVEDHLLLRSLLSELIEYASQVDGVHVEDLGPLVDHVVATGDHAEARRLAFAAETARARVRILEAPLAADLGAA